MATTRQYFSLFVLLGAGRGLELASAINPVGGLLTSVLDSTGVLHSSTNRPKSNSHSAFLVGLENVISECLDQRIILRLAETKMQVSSPALGGLETAGDFPQLGIQVGCWLGEVVGLLLGEVVGLLFLTDQTASQLPNSG